MTGTRMIDARNAWSMNFSAKEMPGLINRSSSMKKKKRKNTNAHTPCPLKVSRR